MTTEKKSQLNADSMRRLAARRRRHNLRWLTAVIVMGMVFGVMLIVLKTLSAAPGS